MKIVTIKPVNPQITNLAIVDTVRDYRNTMLCEAGAVYYNKAFHYYNRQYKDTEHSLLYEAKHHEIPFPLIPNLAKVDKKALRSYLKAFQWSEKARQLYQAALDQHELIKAIKAGSPAEVERALRSAGLDPASFVRRNEDGTSAMRPHQLAALALYITCKFSNNWGQMRTGKTPPTLIYIYWLLVTDQIDMALCVVPNSIKSLWYKEIPKDMPANVLYLTDIIEGTKKKKTELWNKKSWIKIVNYEGLRADIQIALNALDGKRYILVLDEAHNIKNPDSKQTQAVRLLSPDFLVALSGTPVANKPEDVVVPVNITCPNLLGYSYQNFRYEFCKLGGYSGTDIASYQPGALEEIHNRMARISVRALREDLKIGFGKQIQPAELIMSQIIAEAHKKINDEFRVELRTEQGWTALRITSFLARMVRLQQIVAGYLPKVQPGGNGEVIWVNDKDNVKIRWIDQFLADYLDDLGKVVIFSRFIPVIKKLYERYKYLGAAYVCGEVKDKERVRRVEDEFRSNPACKLLIINLDIAAGLDMNPHELPPEAETQVAIFYERAWYYKSNVQAEDRITGINQLRKATIIPLVCKDSIDERLENIVLPKKRRYAQIIQDGGQISEADLESGLRITKQDLFDLVGI